MLEPRIDQQPAETGSILNVSRRSFLRGAGGLALGIYFAPLLGKLGDAQAASDFEPNAFVRIAPDGTVTVIAKHVEMGQGSYTGLATLVAEELDADWNRVQVEGAPADAKRYANLAFGNLQGTGGSNAMANSFEQMRKAGASARAMLVGAAAEQWKVPAAEIEVHDGVVSHAASGHKASFGELAEAAAKQSVPTDVKLKDPKDFKLIGQVQLPRKDSPSKTDGSAQFTQDVHLPDMLVAVVAHPPRFGAVPAKVDASKAKAVPGVVDVVQFPGSERRFAGVAVLAKNTWAARQGRDALQVEWDESKAFKMGSKEIFAQYRDMASKPGLVARNDGDVAKALEKPAHLIEAEYQFPYLAHAAMEPLNCVVFLKEDGCQIWNGEQWQTGDQMSVAQLLGMQPEQVNITQLYAGGSFGRRANPHSDYVLEAAAIAKAARDQGVKVPIKMVWTREDDTRGGYYRPAFLHARDWRWTPRAIWWAGSSGWWGNPSSSARRSRSSWSRMASTRSPWKAPPICPTRAQPACRAALADNVTVPTQWWRSVGHTHTAFSTETLIDEAAIAAKQDPYEFRRKLLEKHPRHRGALELVAQRANWLAPLDKGKDGEQRGRGIAVHESFGSFVAQVVEVTYKADKSFKVDRVVCAVDCGLAINPDVIKAQMEGGIGFALSAALHSAITLTDGKVDQSNFHDFQVLRINEMPVVEVHIVPSAEPPTGVGEPGVPPLAPALANALFAATGKRIRNLPIGNQLQA